MLGLVLEGGGAKGSFHAGALKALYENGFKFDGVMGTSIGAVNGAIIAQGDIEKIFDIWENLMPSNIIECDDEKFQKILSWHNDKESIKYLVKAIGKFLSNKGFDTNNMKNFLENVIDEDKLRNSSIDFGLITYSITDKMPLEIFKEDIPYGCIHDYILASAYYPAFKMKPINGKRFIDGGIYDNLPINPLIRKGYDEIIAIRTMSNMPHFKVIDDTVKVKYILPPESLGGTMDLYPEMVEKNLKMGYYEANRLINDYKGKLYYFYNDSDEEFYKFMANINNDIYTEWKKFLELDNNLTNTMVLKRVLDKIKDELRIYYISSNYETFIMFLEKFGQKYDVNKYKIYDIDNFIKHLKIQKDKDKDNEKELFSFVKQNLNIFALNNLIDILIKNY